MISCDVDDVIVDTRTFLKDEIYKKYGYKLGDTETYRFKLPGYNADEVESIIREVLVRSIDAKPVPKSIKYLKKLYDLVGTRILFVTARKKTDKQITEAWLKKHIGSKFPYEVRYTDGKNKIFYFDKDTKFHIDDHPYFASEAARKLDYSFLIDNSWNQKVPYHKNLIRVDDMRSVYDFVRKVYRISRSI
jgi:uncharacterized HAD superfamily protein